MLGYKIKRMLVELSFLSDLLSLFRRDTPVRALTDQLLPTLIEVHILNNCTFEKENRSYQKAFIAHNALLHSHPPPCRHRARLFRLIILLFRTSSSS